jgi:hypothetical protein
MKDVTKQKAKELCRALSALGKRISAGDDSELLAWVIPDRLACAHRPLRHHPQFGGSGKDLPPEASREVLEWVDRIKSKGIQSIISLMHPKELRHYAKLNLDAKNLIDFYQKSGLEVRSIPWEDPAHRPSLRDVSFQEELARVQTRVLHAFNNLPEPVLLHCSAEIDRSSPVAAYIWTKCVHEEEHASGVRPYI